MDREGIDYTDPEKAEKEKAYNECIKEEMEQGHTKNDILSTKLL